jgi:hypothetical protein
MESLMVAEFLFPLVRMVTNEHEKENHHSFLQIRAHETDEEAMGKILYEHPSSTNSSWSTSQRVPTPRRRRKRLRLRHPRQPLHHRPLVGLLLLQVGLGLLE